MIASSRRDLCVALSRSCVFVALCVIVLERRALRDVFMHYGFFEYFIYFVLFVLFCAFCFACAFRTPGMALLLRVPCVPAVCSVRVCYVYCACLLHGEVAMYISLFLYFYICVLCALGVVVWFSHGALLSVVALFRG